MKSSVRVFRDRTVTAQGNILPFDQFCLCSDPAEHRIQDEVGAYFVQCAEKMLEETIPLLPLSLYRDFAKTGVRSRFEKPHHRRRMMLMYMTLADMTDVVCTGNSGGGTATYSLACLDERITAAMPSCSVCTYEESIAAMPHCLCNHISSIRK